jgi:hypothetical protein
MSDPLVCATNDTLANGGWDGCRLGGEGGQKLKWCHFDYGWFCSQKATVVSQGVVRAVSGSRQRFVKNLELTIHKNRSNFLFAPEVVIESAFGSVGCGRYAVNARLHIADILK